MTCNHHELCKFLSPNDPRFQLVFWLHFEILVNEAISYVAQRQAQQLEEKMDEDAVERLRSLRIPTTRPSKSSHQPPVASVEDSGY